MRVAIIGAGLGGLTAALALRRVGIEAIIFEQAFQFARVGAGIQMPPNAMKVLRALGVESRLREIGLEPQSNLNREHDTGKITNELPLAGVTEEKYGAPFLCIHRADIHATLEESLPSGTVHLNKKLSRYEQSSSAVTLLFSDGTREQFDALIGADGIHSVVREQISGPQQARYSGRVAYRSTYPAARLNGLTIALSRIKWWGSDRHVVMYYTRRSLDEVYVTAVLPEPGEWITTESWSAKGDVDYVLGAFKDFHPDVLAVLGACPSIYKWAIQEREPLPRWSQGRVTMLGDACHAMTPHMAQGGAQAIEDGMIVARCLAESSPEEAFARYESVRKPRTSKIQLMAAENTWMRNDTKPDWVYGYDALNTPLRPE